MPTTCGFPNCKFRSRYRGYHDNRHFYRVPKKPAVLRERWLEAIGRTEGTIVNQVCAELCFQRVITVNPVGAFIALWRNKLTGTHYTAYLHSHLKFVSLSKGVKFELPDAASQTLTLLMLCTMKMLISWAFPEADLKGWGLWNPLPISACSVSSLMSFQI